MLEIVLRILKKFRAPQLVLAIWLIAIFNIAPWKNRKVINNDIIVYYEYLPAFFIFNDPTFKFAEKLPENFHGTIWLEKGTMCPKTTIGLSIMYTPFFFIGHLAAKLLNYQADGYTLPYLFCLSFSGLFYAFCALLILEKILKRYYSSWVTALVIFTFAFATNLHFYTLYEGPLAHAHDFFLISLFLWLTIIWHEKPTYVNSILLGFVFGFIFLVRPVNALIGLIPLLYQVKDFSSVLLKAKFLIKNSLKIIVSIFFAFIAILPQLVFWKINTGKWFFYSYGSESFYFNNPHIIEGLFSYRSGWLLFTPVMFFAIAGLFFIKKYAADLKWGISVFFCVNVYVLFSWWCWWYGGFSIRAMIDTYGILAMPLGAFYTHAINTKYARLAFYLLLGFFIHLNIFQTKQFNNLYVHYNANTRTSYWAAFMKKHPPVNFWDMLKSPDYNAALEGKEEPQGVECFP